MSNETSGLLEYFIKFFDHPFFIIVGGLATLSMIIGFICTVWLVIKGFFPVWYRLGVGLASRKVAIFATEEYESLKSMLVDSRIFQEKNIVRINKNDLKKAENVSFFLVHWKEYHDLMDAILNIKKDSAALIIYAPMNEGKIEDQAMLDKINSHRNSIIVNMRGRLLNDIFISLMTTNYERN